MTNTEHYPIERVIILGNEIKVYTDVSVIPFALTDSRLPADIQTRPQDFIICIVRGEEGKPASNTNITSLWFESNPHGETMTNTEYPTCEAARGCYFGWQGTCLRGGDCIESEDTGYHANFDDMTAPVCNCTLHPKEGVNHRHDCPAGQTICECGQPLYHGQCNDEWHNVRLANPDVFNSEKKKVVNQTPPPTCICGSTKSLLAGEWICTEHEQRISEAVQHLVNAYGVVFRKRKPPKTGLEFWDNPEDALYDYLAPPLPKQQPPQPQQPPTVRGCNCTIYPRDRDDHQEGCPKRYHPDYHKTMHTQGWRPIQDTLGRVIGWFHKATGKDIHHNEDDAEALASHQQAGTTPPPF